MTSNMKETYVLDTFALIAFFLGETGGKKVKEILKKLKKSGQKALLSEINLGELYYVLCRKKDQAAAEEAIEGIERLPIRLIPVNRDLILKAAEIKATKPISFADAFVVALAKKEKAIIVSHDPEFEVVKDEVKILWL